MIKKRNIIISSIATFCAACSTGGGSFDNAVSVVQPGKSSGSPSSVKYINAKVPDPDDLQETGYVVTVLCGEECFAEAKGNDKDKVLSRKYEISENGESARTRVLRDSDFKDIPFVSDFIEGYPSTAYNLNIDLDIDTENGTWQKTTEQVTKEQCLKLDDCHLYTSDYKKTLASRQFDHILLGYYLDGVHYNIFYTGKDKTVDMPISGTATYTGTWLYATQNLTKELPGYLAAVDTGRQYLHYNLDGNKATFSVDFGQKTLNGQLKAEDSERGNTFYEVSATIKNNGFTGSATPTSSTTLRRNQFGWVKPDPTFLTNATVKGSFYGSQATELAGRINENGGNLVGVFAAKRDGSGTEIKTDGDLFQAAFLPLDGSSTSYTVSQQEQFQNTNFSGDIKKLQIDGVIIDLDTPITSSATNTATHNICCDKFSAVSFGSYIKPDTVSTSNVEGGYFVQGFLTPLSQIPTTGTFTYHGNWYYNGYSDADSNSAKYPIVGKGVADFTADFSSKSLAGKLYSPNGVIGSSTPVAEFSATISNNSFSGTTSKLEILNDYGGVTTGSAHKMTGTAQVSGHFYGENANEIGGKIWKEDKSFAGVFGGKQVSQ